MQHRRRLGLPLRDVALYATARQRVEGEVAGRNRIGERSSARHQEVVEPREHAGRWEAGRWVPEVRDDGLHEVGEDLRRAAPPEVERAGGEVLDSPRGLDGEGEVLLVWLVDADVVVGVGEVDRPHHVPLVQRAAERREAAEAALALDAEVVQVLQVEDETLLAVVLDDEGLGDEVEASRSYEGSRQQAAVALGREPLHVLGLRARDAMVKRRGRPVQPIDPHALADPSKDQRGRADLAPKICGRAHAHLVRRQPGRPRRR